MAKKPVTLPTYDPTFLTRKELLKQLRSEASIGSFEIKSRRKMRILVRNVAGMDRRLVASERLFLLTLATVGLLLHGLNSPRTKWNNASAALVDQALAPFAMGGVGLIQFGLATMLVTRKFTDPRLWVILDSMAVLLYLMYLSVSSTLPQRDRNPAMISISVLATVLHMAMIVQSILTLRHLLWALQLACHPSSSSSSTVTTSADSLGKPWSMESSLRDSLPSSTSHTLSSSISSSSSPRPDAPPSRTNVSEKEVKVSSKHDEVQVRNICPMTATRKQVIWESIPSSPIHTRTEPDGPGKEVMIEHAESRVKKKSAYRETLSTILGAIAPTERVVDARTSGEAIPCPMLSIIEPLEDETEDLNLTRSEIMEAEYLGLHFKDME